MITGKQVLADEDLWNSLDGAFFHKRGDNGKFHWQGVVVKVEEKHLEIVHFEWLTGGEEDTHYMVSRLELDRFVFYGDNLEMRRAYEKQEGVDHGTD